jgi:hypothetical protein
MTLTVPMLGFMPEFELPQLDRKRLVMRARRMAVKQLKAVRDIAESFRRLDAVAEVRVPD